MTWHRDKYEDAVMSASGPRRMSERLLAVALARHARSGESSYLTYERARQSTGIASDQTIRKAFAGLEQQGWIRPKERASGRRSGTWWLAIPDAGSQVCSTPAVEQAAADVGPSPTAAVEQGVGTQLASSTAETRSSTDLVRSSTAAVDNHRDHRDHHQPSAVRPSPGPALSARALVVVESLPPDLERPMNRAVLGRWVDALPDAWTADALRHATLQREWSGSIGPGVVISWLEDLAMKSPPAPAVKPAPGGPRCPNSTPYVRDETGLVCGCPDAHTPPEAFAPDAVSA